MEIRQIIKKIWHASLASVFSKIRVYFNRSDSHALKLTHIAGNQAAGININLPVHMKGYFGKMAEGNYESYILKALTKTTDLNNKTIWDIGAHIGYHTLLFAKSVGKNGRVYAFEPNTVNRELLEANISLNKELGSIIEIRSEALSDKTGRGKLLISPDPLATSSSGSHISGIKTPYEKNVYREFIEKEIQLETADNLIGQKILPAPDIIKMDVEGAEFAVLTGAPNLLRNVRPIMIIEIHSAELMHNVLRLLDAHRYATEILDSDSPLLTRNILATPHD